MNTFARLSIHYLFNLNNQFVFASVWIVVELVSIWNQVVNELVDRSIFGEEENDVLGELQGLGNYF